MITEAYRVDTLHAAAREAAGSLTARQLAALASALATKSATAPSAHRKVHLRFLTALLACGVDGAYFPPVRTEVRPLANSHLWQWLARPRMRRCVHWCAMSFATTPRRCLSRELGLPTASPRTHCFAGSWTCWSGRRAAAKWHSSKAR